jgi:hypothetical protein
VHFWIARRQIEGAATIGAASADAYFTVRRFRNGAAGLPWYRR